MVGGTREVSEPKVDLSLLCKVSLGIWSIKSLDMAKILDYFCMKVCIVQCFIRGGRGQDRQENGSAVSGDPTLQVNYFPFSLLFDDDTLKDNILIYAPDSQAQWPASASGRTVRRMRSWDKSPNSCQGRRSLCEEGRSATAMRKLSGRAACRS